MSFEIRVEKRLGDHAIIFDHRSDSKLVALFGPSGAGKTSILNMVAGLIRPDRGRIGARNLGRRHPARNLQHCTWSDRLCAPTHRDAEFARVVVCATLIVGISMRIPHSSCPRHAQPLTSSWRAAYTNCR